MTPTARPPADIDDITVLPDDTNRRAARVTMEKLLGNVEKALAFPGRWCILHTYDTVGSAKSAAMRLRRQDLSAYPGIEIESNGNTVQCRHPKASS